MAHGRQEFALVGYSEDLEKKPLDFVDPIPAARICSACSNVPRLTYTLLCGHIFCEPCYNSCATTSECVCPLDGDVCATAEVTSKEYPAENLLGRKVRCWNEANGCGVVLPASQIAHHVRHDCQHHVTRCPTCFATVLSIDVCAHLKSRCTSYTLHTAPEPQQETDNSENLQNILFEREIKHRVRELDAKLAQLSLESSSQSDKLSEVCHNINHLKEALEEQFEALTRQFELSSVQSTDRWNRNEAEIKALIAHEKAIGQQIGALDIKLAQLSLKSDSQSDKLIDLCHSNKHLKEALEQFGQASDRNIAEIKALYSEKSESLRTALTSVLTSLPSVSKTHQRVMTGYAALKEEALKKGWSLSDGDKVYLQRYLMSWGIRFGKSGTSVTLCLYIQLHEGREDDFLEWPFMKEMKLSIIHPETREERLLGENIYTGKVKCVYGRPIGGSNSAVRFNESEVDSHDIERDGYVKGDQLLLRFELL